MITNKLMIKWSKEEDISRFGFNVIIIGLLRQKMEQEERK
jgi:hypothetical protein